MSKSTDIRTLEIGDEFYLEQSKAMWSHCVVTDLSDDDIIYTRADWPDLDSFPLGGLPPGSLRSPLVYHVTRAREKTQSPGHVVGDRVMRLLDDINASPIMAVPSDVSYDAERLVAMSTWALEQVPVKTGDRVRLIASYDPTNTGFQHFIKAGDEFLVYRVWLLGPYEWRVDLLDDNLNVYSSVSVDVLEEAS